jgi:hypothetical protein
VPQTGWSSVATYSDRITAEAMLGLLRESGIPAHLQSDAVLPGLESFVSLEGPSELLQIVLNGCSNRPRFQTVN